MSSLIIKLLEDLERATNEEIEALERFLWKHHHHHHQIVSMRFGGLYHIDPHTGEIIMALQLTPVGVQETGPVQFFMTDGTLATTPGPIGVLTVDNPLVTISLSANGQSYNVLLTATLGTGNFATITWTDPAGKVAGSSTTVSDEAPANVITTSGLGPLVPGNTP